MNTITYPTFLDPEGNRLMFPTVYYTEQFPKGSQEITILLFQLQLLGLKLGEDKEVHFREDGFADLMFRAMYLNSPALKDKTQEVYVIEGPAFDESVKAEMVNATIN